MPDFLVVLYSNESRLVKVVVLEGTLVINWGTKKVPDVCIYWDNFIVVPFSFDELETCTLKT